MTTKDDAIDLTSRSEPATKPTSSSSSSGNANTSSLPTLGLLLPLLVVWIAQGTVTASGDVWIPLPLIGYLRWDVFLITFLGIELPIFWACYQNKHWSFWLILGIACLLPFIPDSIRPIFYTKSLSMFFDYYEEFFGFPYNESPQVTAHATGLTQEISDRIAAFAWDYRHEWKHVSTSVCLGYYQLGPSLNFDRNRRDMPPFYSFVYGFNPSEERLALESHFRNHFPAKRTQVVDLLQKEMLPSLREAYARTVNVPTDQIVYGDEAFGKLGVPAITIMLGNAAWNSISNIHTDAMYADKFEEKNKRNFFCNSTYDVTTFLLPLTAAQGSGLRYWKKKDEMVEVFYEIGHVYTFNATMIHAIRPLPYKEWQRQQIRMTVQAFGVECDDGESLNDLLQTANPPSMDCKHGLTLCFILYSCRTLGYLSLSNINIIERNIYRQCVRSTCERNGQCVRECDDIFR